ncbi:uncharacterized protein LOC122019549 [Zingiber officinale]|uniref:Uncharacterized protein n=1 Tax=Zingiber officinale TaxID=94328 RepID=A0A8J5F2M0_ZINOF|nr:uncharacterized protein LOC122019549 [Zingiber officinale]KAG6480066.1 hypothetical protein ZIOFF_063544 [Zingiber officinale]
MDGIYQLHFVFSLPLSCFSRPLHFFLQVFFPPLSQNPTIRRLPPHRRTLLRTLLAALFAASTFGLAASTFNHLHCLLLTSASSSPPRLSTIFLLAASTFNHLHCLLLTSASSSPSRLSAIFAASCSPAPPRLSLLGFSDVQISTLKKNEALTREREREIVQVLESVNELVQIMKDLSVLVIDKKP